MIRVASLLAALIGLIFVRATSADHVPVWSLMWFLWIIATCGIAVCLGWFAHEVHSGRRR